MSPAGGRNHRLPYSTKSMIQQANNRLSETIFRESRPFWVRSFGTMFLRSFIKLWEYFLFHFGCPWTLRKFSPHCTINRDRIKPQVNSHCQLKLQLSAFGRKRMLSSLVCSCNYVFVKCRRCNWHVQHVVVSLHYNNKGGQVPWTQPILT